MNTLLDKVRKWVVENYNNREHLVRTADYIKILKPSASEPLLIAAYTHDIERAFKNNRNPPGSEYGVWDDPIYNKWHSKRSAEFAAKFLKEENASGKLIESVTTLINLHEVGGNPDANILMNADSLSFLEVNVPMFISMIPDRLDKRKVKGKFDYMYRRITGEKAKNIAEPLYKDAIRKLNQSDTSKTKIDSN